MYILNGKVYENEENSISPMSQAMMFGYGLFETLKVFNGKILFLEEHLDRLVAGCKILKLDLNKSKRLIEDDCYKLIDKENFKNGVLKILYAKNNNEDYLLLTTRKNSYAEEDYNRGFKLTFSKYKRNAYSKLVYVKSNNYMENILEKEIASENGFDEVIFLNTDDFIAEGAVSNIFWIKDQVIHTPSIDCGLLAGIIRDKVILCGQELGLEVKIGKFTIEDLMESDEAFITNSVMDIMPVCKIENKSYVIGKDSISYRITDKYKSLLGEDYER